MEYDPACGLLLDPPVANSERTRLGVTFAEVGKPASERQVAGSHYRTMKIQPWEIIDAHGLGYYEGSCLKYLLRAGRKGSKLEDLKKARHYLDKMIELEEGGQ
jgi:hypothetical protein